MADPLLLDVLTALGSASIESGRIVTSDEGVTVMGLCEGQAITINEAALVLPIVVHELVHAVRPQATEHAVCCLTARVLRGMSDADVEHVYRLYVMAKRRHRRTPKDAD
jgi:hypothetical protein